MARPSGWDVVGQGADPVAGDPASIRSMAREYGRIADAASDAAIRLRAVQGSGWLTDWQGRAADVFADAIKDTPSDLSKLHASYEAASNALAGWAEVVDDAQYRADGALADAKDAAGDLASAQTRLSDAQSSLAHYRTSATLLTLADAAAPATDAAGAKQQTAKLQAAKDNATVAQGSVTSAAGAVSAAQSRIDAATRLVQAAKGDWEDGEQRTATAIGDAADAGLGKQSFWDKMFHSEVWTEIVKVAQVVVAVGGIIAMIVPGPWTLIIAAVALIVLVDTIYKMTKGEANGWDLAFALLNCVPAAGALGAAAKGAKVAEEGAKFAEEGAEAAGTASTAAHSVQSGEHVVQGITKTVRESSAVRRAETGFGRSYMDKTAMVDHYLTKGEDATLGGKGYPTFFMSEAEAVEHIKNPNDAMIRTGMAPSVTRAAHNGESVFGLRFPLKGLDIRTPRDADAAGNPNFLQGGRTAVAIDGGYMVNPIHEMVIDGGGAMPSGAQAFELTQDGREIILHSFG